MTAEILAATRTVRTVWARDPNLEINDQEARC